MACARVKLFAPLLAGALAPALALAQSGGDGATREAVSVEAVSGEIRLRDPGERSRVLRDRAWAVVDSTVVDARRGRVRVAGAVVASGGMFDLVRDPDGALTMRLRGGDFTGVCSTARAASAVDRGRRRVRRLWADGHGRFRTRGRYSAATVRGTRWLVEDRCDSTVTEVARGEVEVHDFTLAPPAPAVTPVAPPSPTPAGESAPATGAPAPAMGGPDSSSRRARSVRVRRGQRYVARPR